MSRRVQTFEVSLKAFIVRDARVLLVREADTGYWELPGGRIDVGEEWLSHDRVLEREIAEELGAELRVAIGPEVVTWTRQRPTDGMYLFILARLARHVGGEVRLSAEHSEATWLGRDEWQGLRFPPHSGPPHAGPPHSGYMTAMAELWRLVGQD